MATEPRGGRRKGVLTPLLLLSVCLTPAALAQAPSRPPVLVVEDLLGKDWKAARVARQELSRLGARAIPALFEARAAAAATHRVRGPIDHALGELVRLLAEEVGRPLGAAAVPTSARGALGGVAGLFDPDQPDASIPRFTDTSKLGDIGSVSAPEPQDAPSRAQRARTARGALAYFGPFVTTFMLRVPPLRDRIHERVLFFIAAWTYRAERRRALACKTKPARQAFVKRYRGLADLAVPVIAAGLRDRDAKVRALFQRVRDQVLEAGLAGLDAKQAGARRAAEDALFRLGGLASVALQRVAGGKSKRYTSAQAREAAQRLARRIRFQLTRPLLRKLGHDFRGYDKLAFRARRQLVFEAGRLGGADAIPTLRALLREESSLQVKMAAAIGLVRQRDPIGAEWFALHGAGLPKLGLTKRELAAIHMDQGLRHLTQARFERAEREFKRVLKYDAKNEIAWYNLACTYSRWGKVDPAIEHLKKAVEFGFDDTKHMAKDTDLDNIRDDPRYRAIIRKIKASKGEGGQ